MSEDESRLCGIFNLKGVKNKSAIKIKHIQNLRLKNIEIIPDTKIRSFEIMPNVKGEVFQCNITNQYLMSSKTQPMYYVNIVFNKYIQKVLLYKIYLKFTIEDNITSSNQLLNDVLYGKYTTELYVGNLSKSLEKTLDKFIGDDETIDWLASLNMTSSMKELVKEMIADVEKKRQEMYKETSKNYDPPKLDKYNNDSDSLSD